MPKSHLEPNVPHTYQFPKSLHVVNFSCKFIFAHCTNLGTGWTYFQPEWVKWAISLYKIAVYMKIYMAKGFSAFFIIFDQYYCGGTIHKGHPLFGSFPSPPPVLMLHQGNGQFYIGFPLSPPLKCGRPLSLLPCSSVPPPPQRCV